MLVVNRLHVSAAQPRGKGCIAPRGGPRQTRCGVMHAVQRRIGRDTESSFDESSRESRGDGDGEEVPPGLVHEFHSTGMGYALGLTGCGAVAQRPVLHRDGPGPRAGVLRLHHDRGHADGVRRLWRLMEGYSQARADGAQARSVAAGRDHGRGDLQLGVVATLSTTFYPPFMLARLCSTLDHIAGGRFGWNIVTSARTGSAQNFGMDKLTEHDLRYDIADEYLDLVCQLWDSWDADAVVLDRETGTYADFKKVRTRSTSRGSTSSPADHSTRCARPRAGRLRAGRRLAEGARIRRPKYADSIIAVAQRRRGHEGIPRRRPRPGRGARAQSGRHQGAVLRVAAVLGRPRRRPAQRGPSRREDSYIDQDAGGDLVGHRH